MFQCSHYHDNLFVKLHPLLLFLVICLISLMNPRAISYAGQVQYQQTQDNSSSSIQTPTPPIPQYHFQLQEQIEEPLATIELSVSEQNADQILNALHYQWTPLHWDNQEVTAKLTLPLSQAKDLMPHLLHNNKLKNVTLNANTASTADQIQQAKKSLAIRAQHAIARWNNKSTSQQLIIRSINYQTHRSGTLIQVQANITANIVYHADTIPGSIVFINPSAQN